MMVLGFGSYFESVTPYRDIDLLIVHDSISRGSCLKAIDLKRKILKEIDRASVTTLSKSAEQDFDFVNISRAILLETFDENDNVLHIERVVTKISSFRTT
jgi:hypothetical protein